MWVEKLVVDAIFHWRADFKRVGVFAVVILSAGYFATLLLSLFVTFCSGERKNERSS